MGKILFYFLALMLVSDAFFLTLRDLRGIFDTESIENIEKENNPQYLSRNDNFPDTNKLYKTTNYARTRINQNKYKSAKGMEEVGSKRDDYVQAQGCVLNFSDKKPRRDEYDSKVDYQKDYITGVLVTIPKNMRNFEEQPILKIPIYRKIDQNYDLSTEEYPNEDA